EEGEDRRKAIALVLILPRVAVAATIAGKLGNEILSPRTRVCAPQSYVALGIQLGQLRFCHLHLAIKLDAARVLLERAAEEKHVVIAASVIGIRLHAAVISFGLARLRIDASNLLTRAGGLHARSKGRKLHFKLAAARIELSIGACLLRLGALLRARID